MRPLTLYRPLILLALCLTASQNAFSQLTVTPTRTATQLANKLVGPGITISAPVLTCPAVANGTFVSVSTPITIDSGVILTTGKAIQAAGPESFLASTNNGAPGDPALATLAMTTNLYDACILEFDFVPNGDTVKFNYQFGSEEYNHSTCGPYNDAFAFFISGPGITGTQNMALIPGTTIPVTVNSVNSGIPGPGYTLANCTAMGAGSPFTAYYYDNTGGTQVTYKGYTTKMTAYHSVTPCSTYHLKMSICDAGNSIYDSGVFIEAGSLSTNTFWISLLDSIGATINGIPHTIVKGCSPATIKLKSGHPVGTAKTLHFAFGGSAVHGTDYTAPDSATIAAGADSVVITVAGIPTPPAGSKTIELYLMSPYCGIADSVTLTVLDTPTARILTPDTTICSGASFTIRTAGSPVFLNYGWAPPTGLSSTTIAQPVASPATSTSYTMIATLAGSGCPPINKTINVTVVNTSISMGTPNTTICAGGSVALNVTGSPGLTYTWTPPYGLSSATIQNPTAWPTSTTTYTVTATAAGGMCPSTASVTITVGNLNVAIATPDTTICNGTSFTIRGTSTSSGATYTWTPSAGLSSTSVLQPVASPSVSTTYSVVVSSPGSGCPDATAHVTVTVSDAKIQLLTPDTLVCFGVSLPMQLNGTPGDLYTWTPTAGLSNANIANPVASPSITTTYSVTAVSPDGICSAEALVTITVGNPGATILSHDTVICMGASVFISVKGDSSLVYHWSPSAGLSDDSVMNPIASPRVPTTYVMTAGISGSACAVSDTIKVGLSEMRLLNVTPANAIPYGSSIQLNADSALYYYWTPDNGTLDNPNINDPIATPLASTSYTVFGINRYGCRDSATVNVDVYYKQIAIPDAFTPNGDGLNDFFHVCNLGYYKLTDISIFNRWGSMVYHCTTGENKGWDGTYNGVPQDMGTYYYLIIVTGPDGVKHDYKGDLTLIR